ncbi:LysM peptidoglycan-binding domain-containing protein, partial [Actinocrinis puniceicyclus]
VSTTHKSAPAPAPAPVHKSYVVSTPAKTGGHSYTVVSGDTLSQIAAKEGVSNWRTLYQDNESVIGSNPNLIFPGQVLHF